MAMLVICLANWKLVVACYFLYLAYDIIKLRSTLKREREDDNSVSFTEVVPVKAVAKKIR